VAVAVLASVLTECSARPADGPVLDAADSSGGFEDWNLAPKPYPRWLLRDGVLTSGEMGGTLWPPFSLEGRDNYAVEVEIALAKPPALARCGEGARKFEIFVRQSEQNRVFAGAVTDAACPDGESVAEIHWCCDVRGDDRVYHVLATRPFDPGDGWHTYRVEVEGNSIRYFIDGRLWLTANDNRAAETRWIGVLAYLDQIKVRSLKVIGP
jgi:hypothetical protein